MLELLAERFQAIVKKLRGRGKLSEEDVAETLREVRIALLEADVSLAVMKEFLARVKEQASGSEVRESLTPAQSIIQIVYQEMVTIMGEPAKLLQAASPPSVVLLVGLQGSGKTTTSAKLAYRIKQEGGKPLLVSLDFARPAAVRQLEVLSKELQLPFWRAEEKDSISAAKTAFNQAGLSGSTVLILDTAGRQQVDESLMKELRRIREAVPVTETLLVVDAMTGQEAVKISQRFHQDVAVTGVILTKMDGDARGGAALSIRAVTGCPIKFIGTGEKGKTLEPFYPDRLASRILGMGDVLSLIEKVEQTLDEKKGKELEEKLRRAEFSLGDYRDQIRQLKKIGPLHEIMEMLPIHLLPGGNLQKQLKTMKPPEQELARTEAIIGSMTDQERKNPSILDGSRKKRISSGSGTAVADVNQVLKHYELMKKMIKQFKRTGWQYRQPESARKK